MFEQNELHTEALDRLIGATGGLKRGHTAEHAIIEEATGYSQLEQRYYYVVERWRKHMMKTHGIAVMEVPGVGWHLCTRKEQVTDYSRKRTRKARRQLDMNRAALNALPDDDLPPALRLAKRAQLAALKAAKTSLRKKQELREKFNRTPNTTN